MIGSLCGSKGLMGAKYHEFLVLATLQQLSDMRVNMGTPDIGPRIGVTESPKGKNIQDISEGNTEVKA